MVNSRTAY